MAALETAAQLAKSWKTDPRWNGIERPYTPEDVVRLRGTLRIEYTLAHLGAERLWEMLTSDGYVNALGAQTGNQAVQMVAPGYRPFMSADGRWRPTPTTRARCIPTRACIRPIRVPTWCGGSEQCASPAPTRFITPKARMA